MLRGRKFKDETANSLKYLDTFGKLNIFKERLTRKRKETLTKIHGDRLT